MLAARRLLLVDLNNFARFPSLSIGYLAAVLRAAGATVHVFAPLMVGVQGVARETPPGRFGLLAATLNHRVASSSWAWVRRSRERLAAPRRSGVHAHAQQVLQGFREAFAVARPDAVLVSTYLMYRGVCEEICAMAGAAGVPVLIGGPYFAQREVIDDWLRVPGLSALVAGEVELELPAVLRSLFAGGDIRAHCGVFTPGPSGGGRIAAPLQQLDAVPLPDFSDFPWAAYPHRIVPVITGRGCGWGACSFCSDITSTAGRTYRSRRSHEVLAEVTEQHRRYQASRFVFTDLKLNSDLEVWRALHAGMQQAAPGAQWIGAVHAGLEADNGLSDADLRAAAASGCVRLTTGLESGSARILELMKKGTRIELVSRALHAAAAAGISCRCTMVLGYPGELPDDVHASAEFLEQHAEIIERVSLNRLQLIAGTALHRALRRHPERMPGLRILAESPADALVDTRNMALEAPAHRRAARRLLAAVQRINARPLSPRARDFEGVM